MDKFFPTKRLEQVRDLFIFSCFTGLSYIDLKGLKASDIRISFDGKPWIMTHRHKTDTPVNVPLLKIPQAIRNHSIFRHDNFIGCFSADKIKMSARK